MVCSQVGFSVTYTPFGQCRTLDLVAPNGCLVDSGVITVEELPLRYHDLGLDGVDGRFDGRHDAAVWQRLQSRIGTVDQNTVPF